MDLLFKRSQTSSDLGRVAFKLFGKVEFDAEETELVKKYRFDEAVLIYSDQPKLFKKACMRAFGIFIIAWIIVFSMSYSGMMAVMLGLLGGCGYGYWYYHQNRETIYVRDLMHGRYFTCESVVDLARKEAWLETICSFLRQVMEGAKHWDDEVRSTIKALPKEEARRVIIEGI
ncbi:hypothetical protein [Kordiimonas aestuarii]|uniref:hypothetical protein n=1 Tax=Kordiimonas aestuarii TaxID=1005925 RepID=UPI0021D18E63|nr:hypothetical protein [Kordiimonas aestuarii]